MSPGTVVSYGELGVDNIIHVPHLPSPEKAAFPVGDQYQVGGAAANTAVWLAAWDVPVVLTGNAIGNDRMGESLLEWLSYFPRLNRDWIDVRDEIDTPFCRILVTPDGERTILVFRYPDTPVVEPSDEMLTGASFLSLDLYGGEERLRAAALARAAGGTTVVNEVVDPRHPVLEYTDVVVNSAAYVRAVQPGSETRALGRELQRISGGVIITTDGSRPIHVVDRDETSFWIRPPGVGAVNATGAGDAFRAGLVYGLLEGWDVPEAVRYAAAAGALKVAGAQVPGELPPASTVQREAERAIVLTPGGTEDLSA